METLFCSSSSLARACLAVSSHVRGWISERDGYGELLGGLDEMASGVDVRVYTCEGMYVCRAVERCRMSATARTLNLFLRFLP
ncbi:uncharacterized protein CLUP02_16047 [Colletotrichum lupini]|uniref:Uncharacterized protein n=1 Tax=Colletotrichum lupini TaxID=145971 RepID=A0A9Q8WPL0_9PEZI|nr:uncharacterized protein CLUP02_16047 [Colletotrichum lupini]UQC90517.1 hypothetical protein CLUP02_16047 [Colletotrichum lupini]